MARFGEKDYFSHLYCERFPHTYKDRQIYSSELHNYDLFKSMNLF